jgi:hypothetical protein
MNVLCVSAPGGRCFQSPEMFTMKTTFLSLYTIMLALWTGGIAIFTFVVTPVIFRSYPRDTAGEIVGRLFPGYFGYNLALSVLAVVLFLLMTVDWTTTASRLSVLFLAAAIIVNLFIVFKLHPDIVRIKQTVSSFERESQDSAARKSFRKLHALSAVLNLFLLADGVTLLVAAPFLKK